VVRATAIHAMGTAPAVMAQSLRDLAKALALTLFPFLSLH
jgi:hypothetical protein